MRSDAPANTMTKPHMHPLLFAPIYRRYIWGGRRFASTLGRELPPGDDYAESWELVDRGADQSVVAAGPLVGSTLGDLVRTRGEEIVGRHAPLPAFPLLFKFLDASHDLSVQVHPDDARAGRLTPPDRGKTEAWYVIDAAPGSRIYAGLRAGTTRDTLAAALRAGRCGDVLHSFEPRSGDCIFIPAGTVHAIGAGLMVAEIQQSSDITYRLHDWNRVGPDGKPRAMHVEAGLEAVTHFKPVSPVVGSPARSSTREFCSASEASRRAKRGKAGQPQWGAMHVRVEVRGDCDEAPEADACLCQHAMPVRTRRRSNANAPWAARALPGARRPDGSSLDRAATLPAAM